MTEIESERYTSQTTSLELERIIFFSDAVIAIAITLLAVQIGLPPDLSLDKLVPAILDLIPQFVTYALSFLIIGNYWVIHHRVFRHIRRYNSTLIWLNVLFLLFVAFLPVPSHVIGRFPGQTPAIIFFDICLALTGLTQALIWFYASQNYRLIDPHLSPRLVQWGTIRSLIPPGVMVLSILLTAVSPVAAMLAWGLIGVGYAVLNITYPRAQQT